jgi:ammonium transporter, Amt family
MNQKLKILLSVMLLFFAGVAVAQDGVDTGITSWMLTSTTLVLLMIPGLAMFYGGLVRSKNVLGTMMHSFTAMGVMTLLWIAFGYSMSFGDSILGGWFGWNPDYVFLEGIDETIMPDGIPEYVFAMFQGKFAIITPAILAGAFAERVRFKGYVLFIALWGIIVYNPLCHWVWFGGSENSPSGFLHAMDAIDFAGGTVVHISAGVSGLVAAIYLGSRRGYKVGNMPPSNLVMTMMGAGLLWVGWFGFNAGSSVESGLSTAQALTVTQIAAAAGSVAWLILEGMHQGKASALGFASGILAGLVAITPAAGSVTPLGAIALGILSSAICYFGLMFKNKKGYDDSLDAFGIHGLGGIVGAIFLVFFMRGDNSWSEIFAQFGIQSLTVVIAIVYAAVVTIVLLFVVEKTVGLRSKEDEEMRGLDDSYHGERGYGLVNPQ